MSSYVSSNQESQRRARFPTNNRREGLPGDDWHNLSRAQRRTDLERHFSHDGDRSRAYEPQRTAYQDAGLTRDRCLDISEVRNATRSELGPSFDPYDERSHEPSRRRDRHYSNSRGWSGASSGSTAMPRSYHNERERIPRDDRYQYESNHTFNAPWRDHDRLDPRDRYQGEPSTHSHRSHSHRSYTSASSRCTEDTNIQAGDHDDSHWCPILSSRMSWDSVSE